jgi:hypothetical protein
MSSLLLRVIILAENSALAYAAGDRNATREKTPAVRQGIKGSVPNIKVGPPFSNCHNRSRGWLITDV